MGSENGTAIFGCTISKYYFCLAICYAIPIARKFAQAKSSRIEMFGRLAETGMSFCEDVRAALDVIRRQSEEDGPPNDGCDEVNRPIPPFGKGIQAGRAITDVGSGAGAISRVADCHLIMRSHSSENAVVLDATPRSWPSIAPKCLRFNFPVWESASDLDPTELKKNNSKPKAVNPTPPAGTSAPKWTTERFVKTFLGSEPKNKGAIAVLAEGFSGLFPNKVNELFKNAENAGLIYRWNIGPNKPPAFATRRQPETNNSGGGGP